MADRSVVVTETTTQPDGTVTKTTETTTTETPFVVANVTSEAPAANSKAECKARAAVICIAVGFAIWIIGWLFWFPWLVTWCLQIAAVTLTSVPLCSDDLQGSQKKKMMIACILNSVALLFLIIGTFFFPLQLVFILVAIVGLVFTVMAMKEAGGRGGNCC